MSPTLTSDELLIALKNNSEESWDIAGYLYTIHWDYFSPTGLASEHRNLYVMRTDQCTGRTEQLNDNDSPFVTIALARAGILADLECTPPLV